MCDNQVSFYVPRGYDYREVFVKCGTTDPHGGRAICQACSEADTASARSAGWGEY